MLRDPAECPEFVLVVGERTVPTGLPGRRLRPRWLALGRVAFVRQWRRMALAMMIGLTAGFAAGCGSSAPSATGPFISCSGSGLAVPGGQIEALSVEGAPCQTAEGVMSAVIVGLADGKAASSGPKLVEGWNCVTYDGNQATCIRGHATLYAQYTLS